MNAYEVLVRNFEGKKPLRRYRCRCLYNIRMDLREIGWHRKGTCGGLM
jgi:hypothetical protein